MTTFTYWGREYELLDHVYNSTLQNERAVEIPVATHFMWDVLRSFSNRPFPRGLEVGNVLSHYTTAELSWRVVDRYEPGEGVENLDVFVIEGRHDWIVSLSTLEHVRWDEEPRDPLAAALAVTHLIGLLAPGGRMLLSVPMGYHPHLDEALLTGAWLWERSCTLVRPEGVWYQSDEPVSLPYGNGEWGARSVFFGEYHRPL